MAYDKQTIVRISALMHEVKERQESKQWTSARYDTLAFQELYAIVEAQLSLDRDEQTLHDSITVLSFLAEGYRRIGRPTFSAQMYTALLWIASEYKKKYAGEVEDIGDIFYRALETRNIYMDDPCSDLTPVGYILMDKENVDRMVRERMARPRFLKRDPVETTEAYLAVIDEVEELVEQNRTTRGMGSCHEVWMLQCKYLAERGIRWKSLGEMNPGIMFD